MIEGVLYENGSKKGGLGFKVRGRKKGQDGVCIGPSSLWLKVLSSSFEL